MTTAAAELLMNKFYDNEATDAEARELFLHLSLSEDDRSVFLALNSVQDALRSRPAGTVPQAVDQRLSALLMTSKRPSFMHQSVSMSVPSAILSAFVVCLLSLVMFFMMSRSPATRQVREQQPAISSIYDSGVDSDHALPK